MIKVEDLARRRGQYGIDGGVEALGPLGALSLALVGLGLALLAVSRTWWGGASIAVGLYVLVFCAGYLYTTRAGKFWAWAGILRELGLRGDERVLDMGCGRGAVLLQAARLLPRGRAVGIDIWRKRDQSGNGIESTRRNAELEGVADRVELHTGDMTSLPFEDASFDLVLSSLAIHNIRGREGRTQAIDEAARVLKPEGRLVIVDLAFTGQYASRLREGGLEDVERRRVDWRFWFGLPGGMPRLLTARKPPSATTSRGEQQHSRTEDLGHQQPNRSRPVRPWLRAR